MNDPEKGLDYRDCDALLLDVLFLCARVVPFVYNSGQPSGGA